MRQEVNKSANVELGKTIEGTMTAVGNIFDMVAIEDEEVAVVLGMFASKLLNRLNTEGINVDLPNGERIVICIDTPQ